MQQVSRQSWLTAPAGLGGVVVLALALLTATPTAEALPSQFTFRTLSGFTIDRDPGTSSPTPECSRALPPTPDAVGRSHPSGLGIDFRNTQPGLLFLPLAASPGFRHSALVALARGKLTAAARPPLHILFCTWLA